MNVHQPGTQQIVPVDCTIVKKIKFRLWTTLSLCVCMYVCVGGGCYAKVATIGPMNLETAEFQTVTFITNTKNNFLVVDLTFISLFYLASWKMGGPNITGTSSQDYCS